MRIRPNLTTLRIRITELAPSPDGFGAEGCATVEKTPEAPSEGDFIRARTGDTIAFFVSEAGLLSIGGLYEVEVSLNADARGGRIVIRHALPLPD
jgi:hypothetical protein